MQDVDAEAGTLAGGGAAWRRACWVVASSATIVMCAAAKGSMSPAATLMSRPLPADQGVEPEPSAECRRAPDGHQR